MESLLQETEKGLSGENSKESYDNLKYALKVIASHSFFNLLCLLLTVNMALKEFFHY